MSYCDFIAGWGGGMVGLMVGHPFDTVKVNQQTQGVGIKNCFQTIYQSQGLKGFFRGMGFPLLAQGAMNSIFFGVYGYTLDNLDNLRNFNISNFTSERESQTTVLNQAGLKNKFQQPKISYTNCFIAGLVAGLAQVAIACPVDVIKIKLQTRTAKQATFRGPIVLIKFIIKNYGVRGLYQGVGTMTIRDMPASAVYMLLYEIGSSHVKIWSANRTHFVTSVGLFLAGGIAGTVSWWLILPLDVVKSQIQSQDPKSFAYRGAFDSTKHILKQQGPKGLFRGFWALSIRAFPVNGVTLLAYEWFNFLCHSFCETSNSRINAIGN